MAIFPDSLAAIVRQIRCDPFRCGLGGREWGRRNLICFAKKEPTGNLVSRIGYLIEDYRARSCDLETILGV